MRTSLGGGEASGLRTRARARARARASIACDCHVVVVVAMSRARRRGEVAVEGTNPIHITFVTPHPLG